MNKSIVKDGFKLLFISVIYRLMSFAFFSFSWRWNGGFIRVIEVVIGIIFLGIWFIYGLKKKARFKNGFFVGIIGNGDALILIVLSLVLYLNRSSYYFGPIEMALWNIPLFGVYNIINFNSDIIIYIAPIFAIMLTAFGSLLSSGKNKV